MCGYCRFAHIDGRITANPAQYVRRPRVHPTTQRGMDRSELAAFLYMAERTSPMHAAVAVLLGLNGLRISDACGADVEDLGFERGHRTLRIIGKGNKPAIIPLVLRTGRTLDLAIGERSTGPVLTRADGRRLDTRTAYRWVRSIGKRAGLDHVHPHMLRAAFIMAALDAGVPYATFRSPPATPTLEPPRSTTDVDRTSTVTPHARWSPSSPAANSNAVQLDADDGCYGWAGGLWPVGVAGAFDVPLGHLAFDQAGG